MHNAMYHRAATYRTPSIVVMTLILITALLSYLLKYDVKYGRQKSLGNFKVLILHDFVGVNGVPPANKKN